MSFLLNATAAAIYTSPHCLVTSSFHLLSSDVWSQPGFFKLLFQKDSYTNNKNLGFYSRFPAIDSFHPRKYLAF